MFPGFGREQGGYESIYLRAVDPARPRGVWLRHTVHKPPGEAPVGSVWVSIFDRDAVGPQPNKVSVPGPASGDGEWLRVGDSAIGPQGVTGPHAELTWEITDPEPLRHLPREWMYRAALPRTKSESPLPALRFSGRVGDVELNGWPGMLGHNWGDQHAERWIWLHGTAFDGLPDAFLDVVIGRVKVGPVTTPWIANGAVSIGGERTRVSGRAKVNETPLGATVRVGELEVDVRSPREHVTVWRYSDPKPGSEHHTANGSVATLTATLGGRRLHSPHGGVYELGMREQDHGLPVLPFTDP
ncbi:MAG: hypothetical protein QOI80_543 [Solirubrobacteraceae bacterium]|jgi:hypothetical protein|nr:hypothetical protein [Solirubrobacteraceae bacterium]